MNRIIAFDVETPNRHNDRICSIGISVIDDGKITDRLYYLVNPECEFDPVNIGIHGIHPEDVCNAPIFYDVWQEIGPLFRSNLVVAHNAKFDLCVLRKTLNYYDISESIVYFVCTLQMSKELNNTLPDHKLSTLCDYYGIELDHHNAMSDSDGCALILCRYIREGVNIDRFTKSYNLAESENQTAVNHRSRLSNNSISLLELSGILSSMTYDGVLTDSEVEYLAGWLDNNQSLKGNYPYDKIFAVLSSALSDGVLEKSEKEEMLEIFSRIGDPVKTACCDCKGLNVRDRVICLSGEFDFGSKAEVKERICLLGGEISETITRKTEILVVGGQGSSTWSAGNYGNKVKKALELQDKGSGIQIYREKDFFEAMGE